MVVDQEHSVLHKALDLLMDVCFVFTRGESVFDFGFIKLALLEAIVDLLSQVLQMIKGSGRV